MDQVGYRYIDVHTFELPNSMLDGAALTYADETGQHHSLNYDFSAFAKDVPASEKPAPAQASALPESMKQAIIANSEGGKSSPAAAATLANIGHVQTPEEMADRVQAGQASRCAVITSPPGAEIYIDGNKAGVSPIAFVLLRNGDAPRVITIKMNGYKTVERKVVPDGKIIPIGLTLEAASQ
jgi:hypothetical protein